MKEKVCAVLDQNEQYAVKLTEYLNEKRMLPFRTMAFTSEAALNKCKEKYEVEILIVGEALNFTSMEEQDDPKIIFLTEKKSNPKEKSVCRYQSADVIAKEILSNIDVALSAYAESGRDVEVLCIYSPVGRCGKTRLSLELARLSSREVKTLYLNLEEFAGIAGILPDPGKGLSEALYFYKTAREQGYARVLSCTGTSQGFDYFYPVTCADDIGDLTVDELVSFVYMLMNGKIYQRIIIDAGSLVQKPWNLFLISDRIIMPEISDENGLKKIKQLETYLHLSGRSDLWDKIEKYSMVITESLEMIETQMESHARRILSGR